MSKQNSRPKTFDSIMQELKVKLQALDDPRLERLELEQIKTKKALRQAVFTAIKKQLNELS